MEEALSKNRFFYAILGSFKDCVIIDNILDILPTQTWFFYVCTQVFLLLLTYVFETSWPWLLI